MAAQDEYGRRNNRYRSSSYGDARIPEKRHQVNDRYRNSQQPSQRRGETSRKLQIPSPQEREDSANSRGRRISHRRDSPSPPPLNRRRTTSYDRRPYGIVDTQRQQVKRDEEVRLSQYLTPDKLQKHHEYAASPSGTPSSDFPHPYIPKIIVSEIPHHLVRPWTKGSIVGGYAETSSRPVSSASILSGVLGEKTYQYEELGPLEFRLLRLFSKKMSTVKCEIIQCCLREPPEYTAISYAWGDTDNKGSIQIGKISISVAASLFGALDAIRRREEDVLVWVDALCIDQQNRDERSQQVQLMTEIYAKATQVAIWLGPSENDSELAQEFLQDIIIRDNDRNEIMALLLSKTRLRAIEAVAHLFQRDYWKRLWVVQEVSNAKIIKVYCGDSILPWGVYSRAARIFQRHKKDLDLHFLASRGRYLSLQDSLNCSHVLAYEGPNGLLDLDSVHSLGDESLLNVLRAYRRKLTSEPRDRVFGILGVLPDVVRQEFPVDYNLSVKEIYTNVADFLIYTTERLDILCESIHFPKQTSVVNLPSWVPDWSQNPDVTALGYSYDFAAAGDTTADWAFRERRNELEISAVYAGTIRSHGIAVGTHCTLADYLMAFLHWRAILLEDIRSEEWSAQKLKEEAFCKTLCLGQVPLELKPHQWVRKCYRVFATQLRNRLPRLPLDDALGEYIDDHEDSGFNYRQFLQFHFGSRMMGRCFFLTKHLLGMGTGAMLPNDIVVVPLGCRTPIILREENSTGKRFRYVGDAYVDGYMNGEAIAKWKDSGEEIDKFVLV